MKFRNGWIKLHRKILESDVALDGAKINTDRLSLWIYILLNCNIYESKIKHGSKSVTIPPGSMAYSLKMIGDAVDLSIGKIRRILDYLQKTGRIDKQTTNKGSYLIVKKWEEYQLLIEDEEIVTTGKNQLYDNQTTNKRQTNDNRIENKENKNIRKKKVTRRKKKKAVASNAVELDFLSGELQEFIAGVSDNIRLKWLSRYCKETITKQLQTAADWLEAKGREPGNVALLMNTFFKDVPHDKWKDESGGVDPEEKALADMLNSLLDEGKREVNGNA